MQNQSNIIIEKTELQTQTGFGYDLDIPNDYVIYFEKEQNIELSNYIRKNHESLKSKFASIGLNFIYLPFLIESLKNIEELLAYYYPQLNYYQIPEKVSVIYNDKVLRQFFNKGAEDLFQILDKDNFVPSKIENDELLNLLDYKGKIKSGLLFFNMHYGAIGVSDFFYSNLSQNYELFFDEVLFYLKPEHEDFALGEAMIANTPPVVDLTEKLDEEAVKIVNDLKEKLSTLTDSGQLLFIVPILKDLLDKQTEKIDFKSISKIKIDKQNKVLLPYFKKEVELSHLTKSIYFLFLKHPEGINLKELENFKKELLTIYISVSNQLDHDKMIKSVEDVVNLETKAIYTHLSRIKSAFYKIMDASHANHYVISGNGEENRKVLFNTNAIDWYVYDPIEDYEL
jgi:hypothetical protein